MDRDIRRNPAELGRLGEKIAIGDLVVRRRTAYTRYRDWRVIESGAVSGFDMILPDHELTPYDFKKVRWMDTVADSANYLNLSLAAGMVEKKIDLVRPTVINGDSDSSAILRNLYGFADGLVTAEKNGDTTARTKSFDRRRAYLSQTAQRLRAGKLDLIAEMYKRCQYADAGDIGVWSTASMIVSDIQALHLMVGNERSILAGVKNKRAEWQSVTLPQLFSESPLPISHISTPFLPMLEHVGRDELVALPNRMIAPWDIARIKIPDLSGSVEERMERAYHEPRYSLLPGGVPVELRNAGDIRRLLVLESNGMLFAKADTKYGDLTAFMSLDDLSGMSMDVFDKVSMGELKTDILQNSKFGKLMAEVYEGLLCATEVSATRFKRLRSSRTQSPQLAEGPSKKEPGYKLIPQIVRVATNEPSVDRKEYDGPPRPVKPHWVGRAFRRRQGSGMSEGQKEKIRLWREQHKGIRVPVPKAGETVVLPYAVPEGSANQIKDFPKYLQVIHQKRATGDIVDPTHSSQEEEAFYGGRE